MIEPEEMFVLIIIGVIIAYFCLVYFLTHISINYIIPKCEKYYELLGGEFDDGSIMYKIGKKYYSIYYECGEYFTYLYIMLLFFPFSFIIQYILNKTYNYFKNMYNRKIHIRKMAMDLYLDTNKSKHIGYEDITFKECIKIVKKK